MKKTNREERTVWRAPTSLSLKIRRVLLGAIAALFLLFALFLTVGSLVGTADMNRNNAMLERIDFLDDSIIINLLFLLLFYAVGLFLFLLAKRFSWMARIGARGIAAAVFIITLFNGIIWVTQSLSSPTHDSFIVTRAGVAAALGDLSYLTDDYFVHFPFQLGYVLWTELWGRLLSLNHDFYLALEIVNVAALAAAEAALILITDRLFSKKSVTLVTAVTLILFVQPVIFCTFLYGTIPAFAFAAWAIYFFIRYLQSDKWYFILPSGVLLGISVLLKLNNLILLVAMLLILLVHLFSGRPLRRILAFVFILVSVLSIKNVGIWRYEAVLERDFGEGIPMVSWLSMGLSDAETAPGWYNGIHTVTNFQGANGNPQTAAEKSLETVRARLDYFRENKGEALSFFTDKCMSQWNEPTYQSLWNNQVRGQFAAKYGVAAYLSGEGEGLFKRTADLCVQFIFFGALCAAVLLLAFQIKRREGVTGRAALYLIPLFILGGFFYHLLFEAKSQYVITYVTVMIPFAMWGYYALSRALLPHARTLFFKIKRAASNAVSKQ